VTPVSDSPEGERPDTLLITVSGQDHPGITSSLMALLASSGAAIGDVEQVVVRGHLVLGVVAWILTARHVGRVPVLALSWRIVVAGLVMGVAIYPLSGLEGVKVAIPIVAGVVIYAAAVLLLRALSGDEIAWARRALALAR